MAAKKRATYTDILIRQRVISPEQLAEAEQMAEQAGIKVPDADGHIIPLLEDLTKTKRADGMLSVLDVFAMTISGQRGIAL